MKLLTRLAVVTVTVVLLITGVSEWLSHRTTMRFLQSHSIEMAHDPSGDHSTRDFEARARTLGRDLAAIHLVHAVVAAMALILVLTLMWRWLVVGPIQEILAQMNRLSRSVSYKHLDPRRLDEIGQMAVALNRLGDRLTETVGDAMTASELSALALLGGSIVRDVSLVHHQLIGAQAYLRNGKRSGVRPQSLTESGLQEAVERLNGIRERFDLLFDQRLREKREIALREGGQSQMWPRQAESTSR